MIDKQLYKMIYNYSKKFAKRVDDIEDIAQEAVESILKNPPEDRGRDMPNKFYFVVAARAANRFYYDHNRELKNRDITLPEENYDKISNNLIDDTLAPDKACMYKRMLEILNNMQYNNGSHYSRGISLGEKNVLIKILNNKRIDYADRTHYYRLQKNLVRMFT